MVPSKDIQRLEHRLLQELLESDKIQGPEEFLFERLLEWFRKDENERKQHMAGLLELIRLEYISQQFLKDKVSTVFETFHLSTRLTTEYSRRASSQYSNVCVRRSRPIFCLFTQHKGQDGVECSSIKVEKYNCALNSLVETAEISLGDRAQFGVILRKSKVYVLGGSVNNVCQKSVSAYDLNSREEEVLPEMNTARAGFASILVGKHIYVFGGFSIYGCTNSCERFDTETKTWGILKPMIAARYFAAATSVNGYISVAGGRITANVNTGSVELYDPNSDEWVQLAPMNNPRMCFVLINSNGFLYAFGGNAAVERFDSWKTCWTEIRSFDGSGGISSAIHVNGKIVATTFMGNIGHIKFDENSGCSFDLLCSSKYASNILLKHHLYQDGM